jgi:hypothetical protein
LRAFTVTASADLGWACWAAPTAGRIISAPKQKKASTLHTLVQTKKALNMKSSNSGE